MMMRAITFFVYALNVSWILKRDRPGALEGCKRHSSRLRNEERCLKKSIHGIVPAFNDRMRIVCMFEVGGLMVPDERDHT